MDFSFDSLLGICDHSDVKAAKDSCHELLVSLSCILRSSLQLLTR